MLEREFQYYINHQNELVSKYNGKFLVIINNEVVGVFDTKDQAYEFGIKEFKPGTFLIQKCSPGKEDYTATFHSRVSFA